MQNIEGDVGLPPIVSNALVSELWSDFAHTRMAPGSEGWRFALDHPRVRSYVYDTYLDGMDPFGWALTQLLPSHPVSALEIGCGGGDLAIALAKGGRFTQIDAFDLSEGAINLARAKAQAAGVTNVNFVARDCNDLNLPSNHYDFAYASQALHHIDGLEQLFAQVADALKPDGVFFGEDYVGPSRMQYDDHHIAVLNKTFQSLPPEKRLDAWFNDVQKSEIARIPIEDYLRIDPSEGVRAADIIPVMSRYLDVDVRPLGMSVAYEVLLGIVRNFNPENPADNVLIDQIIAADKDAFAARAIPVCFATMVGRKRKAG